MLGLKDRAERRASGVEAAIRGLLAEGDSHGALNRAIRALQSEASKLRRRPAYGPLADAEIAGSIAALAARLHGYKPYRPVQYPVPPDRLLAAFESALLAGKDPS